MRFPLAEFFCQAILGFCNDRQVFFIATVNFICKDAAHHVLIPFLGIFMIWNFPRCHALRNFSKGLPCCVFLKNILHSFGFFLNYGYFSVCDLVAKWQVSLFHFSVRSSESFIPLMSSNSIAVLLTDTFLTISVKVCSSKYVNGGPEAIIFSICFVLFKVSSTFLLMEVLDS